MRSRPPLEPRSPSPTTSARCLSRRRCDREVIRRHNPSGHGVGERRRGGAVTFSVVARDPATRDLGIAVSSCILAVGRAVPSARPGVGVVAVQARSRRGLGPSLLQGLEEGATPAELVRAAAHAAEDVDRQIAVLDTGGAVAADTGRGSFPVSGHLVGDGMSVQGNMLASADVLPAMVRAWDATTGDIADRLLAALAAGQDAGGDLRGRQSAALLVVSGTPATEEDDGVRVDLRVDDSADPV